MNQDAKTEGLFSTEPRGSMRPRPELVGSGTEIASTFGSRRYASGSSDTDVRMSRTTVDPRPDPAWSIRAPR